MFVSTFHTASSLNVIHSALLFFASGGLDFRFQYCFWLVARCIVHACSWHSYIMSSAHIIQPKSQLAICLCFSKTTIFTLLTREQSFNTGSAGTVGKGWFVTQKKIQPPFPFSACKKILTPPSSV